MRVLNKLNLRDLLFIDIETARLFDNFSDCPEEYKDSWLYKIRHTSELSNIDMSPEALWASKAALYAEFAKVICISIGAVKDDEEVTLKSYYGDNESAILKEFGSVADKLTAKRLLCGHAIKGFDIPFLMRRFIVNQIPIPEAFDVGHLKPWEVNIIDTLDLWKGTSWASASLMNISVALGCPSPKQDMEGSATSEVYYAGDMESIVKYCEGDVTAVVNMIKKFKYV